MGFRLYRKILVGAIAKMMSEYVPHITPKGMTEFFNNNDWLYDEGFKSSISVYGRTGSGKDLLFAHRIALVGQPHYAPFAFDYNTIVAPMVLFQTPPEIKYEDIFDGTVRPYTNRILDGVSVYCSDSNIHLPNIDDQKLKSKYPGIHIFSALRRQLNDLQIHINGQTLDRCYKILREQCDCFIWTQGATFYDDYIVVEAITYRYLRHAAAMIIPEEARPEYEIKRRHFLIPYTELHYDTRAFKKVFYNDKTTPDMRFLKELKFNE